MQGKFHAGTYRFEHRIVMVGWVDDRWVVIPDQVDDGTAPLPLTRGMWGRMRRCAVSDKANP